MPVLEDQRWRVAHEHFPLALAAICRNCEAVFEARPICPACTSRSVQSVEGYCGGQREAKQRLEFISAVEAEMRATVREFT
jgi:hypothetical protein